MGPNVFPKTGSLIAGEVTLCATEALYSRVCQHVSPEMTSLRGRVVTLCAVKSLLSLPASVQE